MQAKYVGNNGSIVINITILYRLPYILSKPWTNSFIKDATKLIFSDLMHSFVHLLILAYFVVMLLSFVVLALPGAEETSRS